MEKEFHVNYELARLASWRWIIATALAAVLAVAVSLTVQSSDLTLPEFGDGSVQAPATAPSASSDLAALAARNPGARVEVIVQLRAGTSDDAGRERIRHFGGEVIRELPLINGFGVGMTAEKAVELAGDPAVRAVSKNAKVEKSGTVDPSMLVTAFNQSIRSEKAWASGYTGKGVGVAVIDTGIQGNLPDFRVSESDHASRVIASAVVNPAASTAADSFGHGTHVAGLIAGNGTNRDASDPLHGQYAGVAPDANLISVKASDESGSATVLDVIDGLQFVVDKKSEYNIRVVNLSLRSTVAESYKTDPLDAAVEQAWFSGIVVVAAAGNQGSASDAVSYAPANDPYVITVGGVDDKGTKAIEDDQLAPWSSRGKTQDGFEKPDVVAPGARMVSTMAAGAEYTQLCPSCVVDGSYFRVGGTSMAAAVVAGEVANLIQAYPQYTPNQVKATIVKRTRAVKETTSSSGTLVDASGEPVPSTVTTTTTVVGAEAANDKALNNPIVESANSGLTPNQYVDPATGQIDYSRASWSRASWSDAVDGLRASWSRASWSRASWSRASWSATPESCSDFERASWSRASWSAEDIAYAQGECTSLLAAVDPTRASWSRASWSRASWSSSFDK
jgi:serine protease AprX